MATQIHWPERYDPACTPVHVRNEIISRATPEAIWMWLARASAWPSWYPNSANVCIEKGSSNDLFLGSRFTWRTFGVSIRSSVREFVLNERIAWSALGIGVDAYHAWVIETVPEGTRILTEETQHGWAARLNAIVFPNRMHRFHQIWLERLSHVAQAGPLLNISA
ncbi:MAG: SRPBCC family protein [Dokdonella sp.]